MRAALVLILLSLALGSQLMSAAEFVPPQPYPVGRYEAGWQKNPFTLKTAPVVVARESFAKDLALGSIGGTVDAPSVVLVNTKTKERTLLRGDKPSDSGITVVSVHNEGGRKERYVTVELGTETANIHFDETTIKSASVAAAGAPANRGQPGMVPPGMNQAPRMNNVNMPAAANGANASMNRQQAMPTPPVVQNNGLPPGVNLPVTPDQTAAAGGSIPMPVQRRRLLTNVPQPQGQPEPPAPPLPQ